MSRATILTLFPTWVIKQSDSNYRQTKNMFLDLNMEQFFIPDYKLT